jgi:hypothetical protein
MNCLPIKKRKIADSCEKGQNTLGGAIRKTAAARQSRDMAKFATFWLEKSAVIWE